MKPVFWSFKALNGINDQSVAATATCSMVENAATICSGMPDKLW